MEYTKTFFIAVRRLEAEGEDPAGFLATNEELGLVVEADSLDELERRICDLAPELFELNVVPRIREDDNIALPSFIMQHELNQRCGRVLS